MSLHFSMQEEDIIDNTNTKCHWCTPHVTFSQVVDHFVTQGCTSLTLLNILMPKCLVSSLECQVSWGDTKNEVVDW